MLELCGRYIIWYMQHLKYCHPQLSPDTCNSEGLRPHYGNGVTQYRLEQQDEDHIIPDLLNIHLIVYTVHSTSPLLEGYIVRAAGDV